MLQRWIKNIVVFAAATVFLTACTEKEFSKDEPLDETYYASIYISSQNQILYALDPNTGRKLWEINIGTNLNNSPLVLNDKLILGTDKGMRIVDAKKGTTIATIPDVKSTQSSPAGAGNIVYIGTDDSRVVAVDLNDNSIKWQFAASGPVNTAPTLSTGQVFVASASTVYALDQASGTKVWEFNPGTGGTFTSSPTLELPYVYIGCSDGNLYALEVTNGNKAWEYATQGPIRSSPIVYGGNIIFGSDDNNVYCIDSAAKKERWIYKTTERVVSSPFGYNNVIYIGSFDYTFYAINVIDGELKWRYNTNALVKSSPLAHDGVVYIGSFDKTFYAFDTSGALKWSRDIDGAIETAPVLYDLEKAFYSSISGNSKD